MGGIIMSDLYRKSSVEKLSNPEQLDKAITISSPMSCLALIGVALIVIAVIVWSMFGKLPETQTVSGLIVNKSDVCAIYTNKTGTVTDIKKSSGDKVNPGDVIAVAKSAEGNNFEIVARSSGTLTDILLQEDMKIFAGNEIARLTPDVKNDNVVVCYVPVAVGEQLTKDMDVLIYPASVDSQKYGHMEAQVEQVGEYAVSAANMQYVIGNDNLFAEQFLAQGPVVSVVCKIKTDEQSKNGYFWTNKNGNSLSVPTGTLVSAKIVTKNEAPIQKLFKNSGN